MPLKILNINPKAIIFDSLSSSYYINHQSYYLFYANYEVIMSAIIFLVPIIILNTTLIVIKYLPSNIYFQISVFIIRAAAFIINIPCGPTTIFVGLNIRFVNYKSLLKIDTWPYILPSPPGTCYQIDNIASITWQLAFNVI